MLWPLTQKAVGWRPANEDGVIRLVDPNDGRLVRALVGHSGVVRDLAWSPDGRYLASVADDYRTLVWEAATGQMHQKYDVGARFTSWSPDGQVLMMPDKTGSFLLHQVTDGKLLQIYKGIRFGKTWPGPLTAAAWKSAGPTRSSAAGRQTAASFRGREQPRGNHPSVPPGSQCRGVSATRSAASGSPGRRTAAPWPPEAATRAGLHGQTVGRETLQLRHTIQAGRYGVTHLAWSADGKTLASGQPDWTVRTLGRRYQPTARRADPEQCPHHPGPVLVGRRPTGGQWRPSGRVHVWDLATAERQQMWGNPGGHVHGLAWSPDGRSPGRGRRWPKHPPL